MPLFKRKPKGELEVTVPADCLRGTAVPVDIKFIPLEELTVQEARAELVGEETFWEMHTETETDSEGRPSTRTVETPKYYDIAVVPQKLAELTTFAKGTEVQWKASLQAPADAPPSTGGDGVRIRWFARVVVDVAGKKQLKKETPLRLLATLPPGTDTSKGPSASAVKTYDDCNLSLDVPELAVGGQVVQGKLRIEATKSFGVRGIRVDLEAHENAGVKHPHVRFATQELSGKASFGQNDARELPFVIAVPPNASPTSIGPKTSMRWYVRATLDRMLKTDFNVEREITVWGNPAAQWSGPTGYSTKSRLTAGLLGVLFGGLGIHRFYLGKSGIATIQAIVTLSPIFLLNILHENVLWVLLVGLLWGFAEGVLIFAGGNWKDGRGRPLKKFGG